MLYTSLGGETLSIQSDQLLDLLRETIEKSGKIPRRMLLLPPDHTRLNSQAGLITQLLWKEYSTRCHIDIMPALGTHKPMNDAQLEMMFGTEIPKGAFLVHDWRNDVRTRRRSRSFQGGVLTTPCRSRPTTSFSRATT